MYRTSYLPVPCHILIRFLLPPIIGIFNQLVDQYVLVFSIPGHLLTALIDSSIHAITGSLLTLSIFYQTNTVSLGRLVLLSYFISAFVDLDHFIAAGSLTLANVMTLKHRPFLHNTLTVLILCAGLFLFGEFFYRRTEAYVAFHVKEDESLTQVEDGQTSKCSVRRSRPYVPFMVTATVSLMAHHTRDAIRRGFWFGPFGSTPPITYIQMVVILYSLQISGRLTQRFNTKKKDVAVV